MRYVELKHKGQTITEKWRIEEILLENKFNWVLDAEIENARIEIFEKGETKYFVWNSGTWYNGDWYFGVWRDGEWKYGTWRNGVWRNGKWKNGTFKSGIIYKGIFIKGKIESGEIRGGQFIDIEIAEGVTELTEEETIKTQIAVAQVPQTQPQAQPVQPVQPTSGQTQVQPAQVQAQPPVSGQTQEPTTQTQAQPVQQQKESKNNITIMKKNRLSGFIQFVNESTGDLQETFVKIKGEFSTVDIKQEPGIIIIEAPSEATIDNIKKQYGGEVINKNGVYYLHIKDKK